MTSFDLQSSCIKDVIFIFNEDNITAAIKNSKPSHAAQIKRSYSGVEICAAAAMPGFIFAQAGKIRRI